MADRNQEYVYLLMDIVLATINAKWIHPSLALKLLKVNLGELEESCEILEFALRQPLNEKIQPILAARPKVLGLSVSIWNHKATLELLKELSEKWAGADGSREKPLIVLGGPEVSYLSEDVEIFRYADYVIRGEGEESFRLLCHEIFSGRKDAAKVMTGAPVNVNKIVSPYRLYTDEELNRKLVYVEAARGCPFACEFCSCSIMNRVPDSCNELVKSVREFPLESFLAEMGILIKRGGRTFKFLDRTFNLNMGRVKRIMEFFLEHIDALIAADAVKDRPLCVHFEMVPFLFPSELKDILRRFPPESLRLELGIQTLNQQTASLIHIAGESGAAKLQSAGRQTWTILENLEFLRKETNAIIHADLIAGLPGEDFTSFGSGFDQLWQVLSGVPGSPFEIQLGILKCLPGTPIIRHSETHKMLYAAEPPYEVIATGALHKPELDRIKNFARFWELIVNRNPFPEILPVLLPSGEPAFEKFMMLSDELLEKLGRNWGIDREELRACVYNFA